MPYFGTRMVILRDGGVGGGLTLTYFKENREARIALPGSSRNSQNSYFFKMTALARVNEVNQ